jgi:hypothetical protein
MSGFWGGADDFDLYRRSCELGMDSNQNGAAIVDAVTKCGVFDEFGIYTPVREGFFELFDYSPLIWRREVQNEILHLMFRSEFVDDSRLDFEKVQLSSFVEGVLTRNEVSLGLQGIVRSDLL